MWNMKSWQILTAEILVINRLPIKFPKDLNWLNENRFSQCVNGNIINDHLNDSGVGI